MKSTSAHSHSDNISGLNTFTAWLPAIAIGPRFLSCLRINAAVTLRAARLDTGPVASRYPGGILPRLSRPHCQVASFNALLARASEDAGPFAEAWTCVRDEALRQ